VYGWTIERIAYKPLRNSTRLAPLISAIGMSLILQNYAQLSQGRASKGCQPCWTAYFVCIWAKVLCR
jgi:branched-chain amino acid transport system permease protein